MVVDEHHLVKRLNGHSKTFASHTTAMSVPSVASRSCVPSETERLSGGLRTTSNCTRPTSCTDALDTQTGSTC